MPEKDNKSHPIDPPLEIDIPGYSEKTRFYAWEELHQFVEEERTAWAWVGEERRAQLPSPLGPVASLHLAQLNHLQNWASPDAAPPGPEQYRNSVMKTLGMYRNGDLVCSKSADGQYILDLGQTDPRAALGALAFLASQHWSLHEEAWRDVLRGATKLALSRSDKKGSVARTTKALDALQSEWATRLDEEKSLLEELREEVQKELNTTQGQITTAQERVSKFWVNQGNKARELYRQARSDKDDLERAFIEHMRLKAPAEYWRNKAISHLCWAIGAFLLFALISALAAKFLIDHAPEVSALVSLDNAGGFPWGNIVIITLPALAFFWFLRFIARIFVTNLQRQQDARERTTMVETYLALIREGENVAKPDERILILNALFRPGPGDAPDMAPPADLLDIIKRGPKE